MEGERASQQLGGAAKRSLELRRQGQESDACLCDVCANNICGSAKGAIDDQSSEVDWTVSMARQSVRRGYCINGLGRVVYLWLGHVSDRSA